MGALGAATEARRAVTGCLGFDPQFGRIWPTTNFTLFLVVFWWCLKCARLEFSGCRQPETAWVCTCEGPGLLKNHQNSTRRHTVREKKSENGAGEKKSATFWASGRGGSGGGRSGGRWGERTKHNTPTHQQHTTTHNNNTHNNNTKNGLAKNGLAKVDHDSM